MGCDIKDMAGRQQSPPPLYTYVIYYIICVPQEDERTRSQPLTNKFSRELIVILSEVIQRDKFGFYAAIVYAQTTSCVG